MNTLLGFTLHGEQYLNLRLPWGIRTAHVSHANESCFIAQCVQVWDGTALMHPGLAEIPATDGSQDVTSQLKDYPFRQ